MATTTKEESKFWRNAFHPLGKDDKRLIVYNRVNEGRVSPIWQARIKFPGKKPVPLSLKTESKKLATEESKRLFREYESKFIHKVELRKVSVSRLIDAWIEDTKS